MFKKAKELSDEKVSLIRLSRPQLITIHNVLLLLLERLLKSLKKSVKVSTIFSG